MAYQYHMVQIPSNISVRAKDHKGNEAAAYLQATVSQMATQGWEFYRVDPIGVDVQPGCLGILLGHKAIQVTYYVITFRAPA